MTATVITTKGLSEIILKPENEFEKMLIDSFEKSEQEVDPRFRADNQYGIKTNHKIHIFITTKNK